MTWLLLLEMILQVPDLFSTSLVNILRWKIWAFSAIFLGLRLPHPLMDIIFLKLNMFSDLLSKSRITDNKTISTPLEYTVKLTTLDGEPLSEATHYR